MKNDPIHGKTLRFSFEDGPMAHKTYEHVFADDSTVTYRPVGADSKKAPEGDPKNPKKEEAVPYRVEPVSEDVYAVSYVGMGYTLTTILDFKTKKLVAFSSDAKAVTTQHGTFN